MNSGNERLKVIIIRDELPIVEIGINSAKYLVPEMRDDGQIHRAIVEIRKVLYSITYSTVFAQKSFTGNNTYFECEQCEYQWDSNDININHCPGCGRNITYFRMLEDDYDN